MSEEYPELRKMSKPELLKWIASWKAGSHPRLVGEEELARRKSAAAELRGWLAIGISVVSLIVAMIALLRK